MVMGLVHLSKVKKNADAKVGDVLILGKPIGVGVLSAALKKKLSPEGYAAMIAHHQAQQARRRARQHCRGCTR